MKIYPKANRDISRPITKKQIDSISSDHGSLPDLVNLYKTFYKEAHPALFEMIVKQVWLEGKFVYDGARRTKRGLNGYGIDWSYAYFMTAIVGVSQKTLTSGAVFMSVPTYFKDFFPKFSEKNPFEEPEYFKFPYEHVTLDFLYFVYQHHERIEMLNYAEKKKMNIREFQNWAVNQAMCYNNEIGDIIYEVKRSSFIPYLKKIK